MSETLDQELARVRAEADKRSALARTRRLREILESGEGAKQPPRKPDPEEPS